MITLSALKSGEYTVNHSFMDVPLTMNGISQCWLKFDVLIFVQKLIS